MTGIRDSRHPSPTGLAGPVSVGARRRWCRHRGRRAGRQHLTAAARGLRSHGYASREPRPAAARATVYRCTLPSKPPKPATRAAHPRRPSPMGRSTDRGRSGGRDAPTRGAVGLDRAGPQRLPAAQPGIHPGRGRPALGDGPHDQRLPAPGVAGDEHAGHRWSCRSRRARRCRARRARRPSCSSRPACCRAEEAHREQHQVGRDLALGARDRLEAAVDACVDLDAARSARDAARRSSPTNSSVLTREDPLAALLVGAGGAVDQRPGRPRVGVRRARPAGRGRISSWVTDAAPCRCAVPRQSAPVSPPPMITTCLPCGA